MTGKQSKSILRYRTLTKAYKASYSADGWAACCRGMLDYMDLCECITKEQYDNLIAELAVEYEKEKEK